MSCYGYIISYEDCIKQAIFITCPVCHEVMEEDAGAYEDYHHVFDYPEEEDKLTGYSWCFGKCNIYIVDPFIKPEEINFEDLPESLRNAFVDSGEEREECKYYKVYYAKVKEFVNNIFLKLKCDSRLKPEEIKSILKNNKIKSRYDMKIDKEVFPEYGIEKDKTDIYDLTLEERNKKFNFGYPINSYNPFDIDDNEDEWFDTSHDGRSHLLKCVSKTGKEFDFLLSGD
jgi:hypothetical protein